MIFRKISFLLKISEGQEVLRVDYQQDLTRGVLYIRKLRTIKRVRITLYKNKKKTDCMTDTYGLLLLEFHY